MKPLLEQLSGLDTLTGVAMGGLSVQLQPIPGTVPVIQVSIEGREELPIFLTCSDSQILCMCYLWSDDEVLPDGAPSCSRPCSTSTRRCRCPRSAASASATCCSAPCSRDARVDDVAKDVAVLSDNALDALDALSEFLK